MSFIDLHRKAWALRCLREAKVDLNEAKKAEGIDYLRLALSAMKKARDAVYYSLGDPYSIYPVIQNHVRRRKKIEDPLLQFLVEIENAINGFAQPTLTRKDDLIDKTTGIVSATEEIVRTIIGKAA